MKKISFAIFILILILYPQINEATFIKFISKNFPEANSDDSQLIQQAIDDVISESSSNNKGILLIAPGDYFINRTLNIQNAENFHLIGAGGGTVFHWKGSQSEVINITDTQNSELSHFKVNFQSMSPGNGIKIISHSNTHPSSHNIFKNVEMSGNQKFINGIQIGESENDLQNDRHLFKNIAIESFQETGILIYGEKSTEQFFYNAKIISHQNNSSSSINGIKLNKGSFLMLGGGIGHCGLDFDIEEPSDKIVISHINNEDTNLLIHAQGGLNHPLDITLEGSRVTKVQRSSDNPFMQIYGEGYFKVVRNLFESHKNGKNPDSCNFKMDSSPTIKFEFSFNHVFQDYENEIDFYHNSPHSGYGNIQSEVESVKILEPYSTTEPFHQELSNPQSSLREMLREVLFHPNSLFLFANHHSLAHRIINVRKIQQIENLSDTEALNKALTLATYNPEKPGIVLIPEGTYSVNRTLRTFPSRGVSVVGGGIYNTILQWEGNSPMTGSIVPVDGFDSDFESLCLDISSCQRAEFRDFSIDVRSPYELNTGIRVTSSFGRMPGYNRYEFSQKINNRIRIINNKITDAYERIISCYPQLSRGPQDDPLIKLNKLLKITNFYEDFYLQDPEHVSIPDFEYNSRPIEEEPYINKLIRLTNEIRNRRTRFNRLNSEERFNIMSLNRILLQKRFSFLPQYDLSWQNVTSTNNVLENILISSEDSRLLYGVCYGSGNDANNDFHLNHNVQTYNYKMAGFRLCNSQIFNLFFIYCHMWGVEGRSRQYGCIMGCPSEATFNNPDNIPLLPPAPGNGLRFKMGSMNWIGGYGGGNGEADFFLGSAGNGPITIADFHSQNSKSLIQGPGPNMVPIVLTITGVNFQTDYRNIAHNFLSLYSPGTYSIENNKFRSNGLGKIKYDYNRTCGWNSMVFFDNTIKSATEQMVGDEGVFKEYGQPTLHKRNTFLLGQTGEQVFYKSDD